MPSSGVMLRTLILLSYWRSSANTDTGTNVRHMQRANKTLSIRFFIAFHSPLFPMFLWSFPLVRRRTAYGERGQAASRRYTVGVNLPAVTPVLSRPRCKTPFPLPLRCSLFPRFLRRRAGTNLRCISSPNQLYRNSYRKSTIARKILWYLNKTGRGATVNAEHA